MPPLTEPAAVHGHCVSPIHALIGHKENCHKGQHYSAMLCCLRKPLPVDQDDENNDRDAYHDGANDYSDEDEQDEQDEQKDEKKETYPTEGIAHISNVGVEIHAYKAMTCMSRTFLHVLHPQPSNPVPCARRFKYQNQSLRGAASLRVNSLHVRGPVFPLCVRQAACRTCAPLRTTFLPHGA